MRSKAMMSGIYVYMGAYRRQPCLFGLLLILARSPYEILGTSWLINLINVLPKRRRRWALALALTLAKRRL